MAQIRILTPSRTKLIERKAKPSSSMRKETSPSELALGGSFRKLQQISNFADANGLSDAPLMEVVSKWKKANPLG